MNSSVPSLLGGNLVSYYFRTSIFTNHCEFQNTGYNHVFANCGLSEACLAAMLLQKKPMICCENIRRGIPLQEGKNNAQVCVGWRWRDIPHLLAMFRKLGSISSGNICPASQSTSAKVYLPAITTEFTKDRQKLWDFIVHHHFQLAISNTISVYYYTCR